MGGTDGIILMALPGWRNMDITTPSGEHELHLVPVQDIHPHYLGGDHCTCGVEQDSEFEHYWKHKAFDGRESYESGHRKFN